MNTSRERFNLSNLQVNFLSCIKALLQIQDGQLFVHVHVYFKKREQKYTVVAEIFVAIKVTVLEIKI